MNKQNNSQIWMKRNYKAMQEWLTTGRESTTRQGAPRHRLSALHTTGALSFLFVLTQVDARINGCFQTVGGLLSHKAVEYTMMLGVMVIAMIFIFVDAWAHDEDPGFAHNMFVAPRLARIVDFFCRGFLYVGLTAVFITRFSGIDALNSCRTFIFKAPAADDATCLAILLVVGFQWLRIVGKHRGAVPITLQDDLSVSGAGLKFRAPYVVLLVLLLLPFVWSWGYENGPAALRLIGLVPLASSEVSEKPAVGVFVFVTGVVLGTICLLVRRNYWRAALFFERRI